eukprot:scaffold2410_cov116-Cylindrotheca_fusiformis.AAC.2
MTTEAKKAKKHLHVETESQQSLSSGPSPPVLNRGNQSPPSVAPLSIQSSSSSVSETDPSSFVSTPRDQPVMAPELQEQKTKDFVHGLGLQWSDCNLEQQKRAMKFQSPDFTWSPTRGDAPPNHRYTTTFKDEWEKFIAHLPEPHKTAFSTFEHVFFDEGAITNFMAIRRHLSGICSAHASVLVQHYIESCRRASQEANHEMLDISSFIRNDLPKEKQKRYIQEGVTGHSSFELLKIFTKTKDFEYDAYNPCPKFYSEFDHHGDIELLYERLIRHEEPGLVSNFMVGDEFCKKSILEGTLDEEGYEKIVRERKGKPNLHAMVLLGAYLSPDDGRYWFLLQNTHENAYFKLVDGEYLASCEPTVYFARQKCDMSLKGTDEVVMGEYIETAVEHEECMTVAPAEG